MPDTLTESYPATATQAATNKPEIGSPEWWRDRLHTALKKRARTIAVYDAYYCGNQPLAFASKKFREAFGGLFREFADNWTSIVVDAVKERLTVQGFRYGDEPKGDKEAWAIWQANQLDAESQIGQTDSLVFGCTYALVWPSSLEGKYADITVESPLQVITEAVPGRRQERAAGYKEWRDDWTGKLMATLYLPDYVYKWTTTGAVAKETLEMETLRWEERKPTGEGWPLPNKFLEVPVVPFPNKPRSTKPYESEIHGVIPIQDAVNKLVADLLTASEFGAFPQRWATGLEVTTDENTGQAIEPLKAALDRLWVNPDPAGSFGAFPSTDLGKFVEAIEMFIHHIASLSRTPPHYFFLRGEVPSGESMKAAETGLTTKAREKMLFLGEAWEEVMGLAFKAMGSPKANQVDASEVIWKDPESRSESEHVDAVMKMQALGIPQEALWEDLGFSPQQIERFVQMRDAAAAAATPKPVVRNVQRDPGGKIISIVDGQASG